MSEKSDAKKRGRLRRAHARTKIGSRERRRQRCQPCLPNRGLRAVHMGREVQMMQYQAEGIHASPAVGNPPSLSDPGAGVAAPARRESVFDVLRRSAQLLGPFVE